MLLEKYDYSRGGTIQFTQGRSLDAFGGGQGAGGEGAVRKPW